MPWAFPCCLAAAVGAENFKVRFFVLVSFFFLIELNLMYLVLGQENLR